MNLEIHFPRTRCLFTVEAENDPQLPCRILGLLTLRGFLPDGFSVRKICQDGLRVTIEISDLDDQACALLAKKILHIPTVWDVSRSWLRQRAEIAA